MTAFASRYFRENLELGGWNLGSDRHQERKMNIAVDADYGLVFDLFDRPDTLSKGRTIELAGGCTLSYDGAIEPRH